MKKQITPDPLFCFPVQQPGLPSRSAPNLSMLEESPAGSQILQFLETINANSPVDEALVKNVSLNS